jgi:hypothetical protein
MPRLKLHILGFLLLLGINVLAVEPLPRVLVLGDSFYQNLTHSAAKEFNGRAQVVYANPGDSSYALANLDELLGKEKWSVIYFCFGIADLCYKHPDLKGVRALSKAAGGVRVSSPELYEKNLTELVPRLKATGAKIIWATTTPPVTPGSTPNYDPGSEDEYNKIAAKVMAAQSVTVNDMYVLGSANAKNGSPTAPLTEAFHKAIETALEPEKK